MGKRFSTRSTVTRHKEHNRNLLLAQPEEYTYTIKKQHLQQLLTNVKHRLDDTSRNLSRREHRIVDGYMAAFTNRSNGFDVTSELDRLRSETSVNDAKLQELAQDDHKLLYNTVAQMLSSRENAQICVDLMKEQGFATTMATLPTTFIPPTQQQLFANRI